MLRAIFLLFTITAMSAHAQITPPPSGGGSGVQSLTTTGTSGASTLTGTVLNVPQYSSGISGGGGTAVWQRQGVIIPGDSTHQYASQEPSLNYDAGIFKLWYICGWSTEGLCYATSPTALPGSWTIQNGNVAVIANTAHGYVFKNGATWYYYGTVGGAGSLPTNFGQWTSSDGITWTNNSTTILPAVPATWESGQRGNIFVWIEGGTWYAIYDALGSDTVWRDGLATSSDGLTWTKYGSNPIIQYGRNGTCGGPQMKKVSSTYYVWTQCAPSGYQPTDIYMWQSTDLHAWTLAQPGPVFARQTPDEGPGTYGGQIGDFSMVEVNGVTYTAYGGVQTQSPGAGIPNNVKLLISNQTVSQIVAGNVNPQGDGTQVGLLGTLGDGPYGWLGPQYSPDGTAVPRPDPNGHFSIGNMNFQGTQVNDYICFNCYWDPVGATERYVSTGAAAIISADMVAGKINFQMPVSGGTAGGSWVIPGAMMTLDAATQQVTIPRLLVNQVYASSNTASLIANTMQLNYLSGTTGRAMAIGTNSSTVGILELTGTSSNASITDTYLTCNHTTGCSSVDPYIITNSFTANTYKTGTNCSSSAAPAVCAAAPNGSVVVAAAGTTVTVNTTAVTANSQIFLQEDSSLGTKLSVTCNTTPATALTVTGRTAATSFVITTNAPSTNPRCISYRIEN